MRIVALVTQKGGSGKSTLSAALAVEAQANGEIVFLVDMDPQRSLARWAQSRTGPRIGGAAIEARHLDAVLASLEARGVTLVIIDTPASLSPIADSAIEAADLVVVPVRPSVLDIWSCEATWARVRDLGKTCVFVLNQCSTLRTGSRVRDGAAALEAMGALLQPMITARTAHQDAVQRGLGPTELDASGAAADEIRQLWTSLNRRLSLTRFQTRTSQAAA